MKERLLDTFYQFRDAMFRNDTEMIDRLMADEYIGFDPIGNPQDKKLSGSISARYGETRQI